MNLFDRLDDLLALDLDRACESGPEPTAAEVFGEMEELVAEARCTAARMIAAERRLAWNLAWSRAEAGRWEARAVSARAAGRHDLARRGLSRRDELDKVVRDLEAEHEAALRVREMVQDCLALLEARLVGAGRMSRLLA